MKDINIIEIENNNIDFRIGTNKLIEDSKLKEIQKFLIILLTKPQSNIFNIQFGTYFEDTIGKNYIQYTKRQINDAISYALWYLQNINNTTIENVTIDNMFYSEGILYIELKFDFQDGISENYIVKLQGEN